MPKFRHFHAHHDHGQGRGDFFDFGAKGADWLRGSWGDDRLEGTDGDDVIRGRFGDDTLEGGAGDDVLRGGFGTDTAVMSGSVLDYSWDSAGRGMTVTDHADSDGTDRLHSIEVLQFGDYTLDLEGDNAALVTGAEASASEDEGTEFTLSAHDFDGGVPEVVSVSVSGGGSVSLVGTQVNDAAQMGEGRDFTFAFDPGDAYDWLGEGESVTETVTVIVSDGQGNETEYSQEITIEGVNDAPEFDGEGAEAEVFEDGVAEATGQVTATDGDAGDSVAYSIEGGGAGAYGTLSLGEDGAWTYTLAEGSEAVEALDEGETAQDSFTILATDGSGAEDRFTLHVNVHGAADAESVTLDFEDIEVEGGDTALVEDGYGGFTWSGAAFVLETDEFRGGGGTPYHDGASSGDNVVVNTGSGDIGIASEQDFSLESANFHSASLNGMELTVTGYNDGEVTGSQTFILSTEEMTEAEFDPEIFGSVDEVVFSSEYDMLGEFTMDDLTYTV